MQDRQIEEDIGDMRIKPAEEDKMVFMRKSISLFLICASHLLASILGVKRLADLMCNSSSRSKRSM